MFMTLYMQNNGTHSGWSGKVIMNDFENMASVTHGEHFMRAAVEIVQR